MISKPRSMRGFCLPKKPPHGIIENVSPMLSYNELKIGTMFRKNEDPDPYEVLEYAFIRMQQRKPVTQLKIKNLLSGKVQDYTAHQNESFYEIEIDRIPVVFIYHAKNEYWFHEVKDKSKRFSLNDEIVGDSGHFLKANMEIVSFRYGEKLVKIELPVKVDLKVTEAPPAVRGNTSQGGTKSVVVETGAKVDVPLFINEGDIIRINTQTGDYVERAEKN